MPSIARCAVVLLASTMFLVACGGDDWETVVIGGPDGCWELSYSSYWVADEAALDLGRPHEMCPFDLPARTTDGYPCLSDTGLFRWPLLVATGSDAEQPDRPPPSVMVTVEAQPQPSAVEQAECVRLSDSIRTSAAGRVLPDLEISTVFERQIGDERAACINIERVDAAVTSRTCWFEVGHYVVRVQGGDYRRHGPAIEAFFRDTARSLVLDPGRACDPTCDQ